MKKILFLCTGNYYRSKFCEHLFNDIVSKKQLNWKADSRGLNVTPEHGNVGAISIHTIEGLKLLGIDIDLSLERDPLQVKQIDLESADKIVAVDRTAHLPMIESQFPEWVDKIEYWEVKDLGEVPNESPLLQLEKKINLLINNLS